MRKYGKLATAAIFVWGFSSLSACEEGIDTEESVAEEEEEGTSWQDDITPQFDNDPNIHGDIVKSAVNLYNDYYSSENGIAKIAADTMDSHANNSDNEGTVAHDSAYYHFANCHWVGATSLIEDQDAYAIESAVNFHNIRTDVFRNAVYDSLGYSQHAVQDFYAHSNWVDNHTTGDLAVLTHDFWPNIYWWSVVTTNKTPLPGLGCDGLSHDEYNHDNDDSMSHEPYYDAAYHTRNKLHSFVGVLKNEMGTTAATQALLELGFYNITDVTDISDVITSASGEHTFFFFVSNGRAWYIRYYNEYTGGGYNTVVEEGYPKLMNSTNWPNIPSSFTTGIDAALNWNSDAIYFFKGSTYARWDVSSGSFGTLKNLDSDHWSGWPSSWTNVDAAINWAGYYYFFRGSYYIKVNSDWTVIKQPTLISSGWPGLWTSGIDGAFKWFNGKAYFFKNGQYMRISDGWTVDDGYPNNTIDYWPDTFYHP